MLGDGSDGGDGLGDVTMMTMVVQRLFQLQRDGVAGFQTMLQCELCGVSGLDSAAVMIESCESPANVGPYRGSSVGAEASVLQRFASELSGVWGIESRLLVFCLLSGPNFIDRRLSFWKM